MAKKEEKTNVVRLLEANDIPYEFLHYESDTVLSGSDAARLMGVDPDRMFKTLVTTGASKNHYVFMIPVDEELDLKKAAAAAGEKSIEMLKAKDLLPLTGYIHGGCSPIGMKKQFRTFIDELAILQDRIVYSAGRIACSVDTTLSDLQKMVPVEVADVIK